MECLAVAKLPEGPQWVYEIKLDGYRAEAVRNGDGIAFYSRNGKSLNKKFPYIVEALSDLPLDTVIDGEMVALDESGRPTFNLLQNHSGASSHIRYFVFDVIVLKGRDLTRVPFIERRKSFALLSFANPRIAISEFLTVSAETMLAAVKQQGLEGVVAKRKDSFDEAGERLGAWVKHRVNLGQEFVIGGYTPGAYGIDAIIVGYYRGRDLIYIARTRNGFVQASRRSVFQRLFTLKTEDCPFTNLPEMRKARWGEAMTAEKMKECVWVRPELVAQIEFLEWTDADHLRHSKFVGLRDDKDAKQVVKEKVQNEEHCKFYLSGYGCQLRRSMQHWPEVYPRACGILKFFSVVDSRAARLGRAALESSQTDRYLEGSIAAAADWCFRSCRAAMDFADRKNTPAHR
jgi:DNA ligase D-like protein (predicted ligase)